MAHINLLPWRAERRKRRRRGFVLQWSAACAAALLLLCPWISWLHRRIDSQDQKNRYLRGEISQLDSRVVEMNSLQLRRRYLLAREQTIERLQASRSMMVHLFDELVKTTPPQVRIASLKQTGDSLSLEGVAQSNADIAEYMRRIEASPWMGHVDLRKSQHSHDSAHMPFSFELEVSLGRRIDGAGHPLDAAPDAPKR